MSIIFFVLLSEFVLYEISKQQMKGRYKYTRDLGTVARQTKYSDVNNFVKFDYIR